MIDFNFLRIRWPKLAAIAADASRLVEVSPTSAIGTMQNFCEWAADIALDFYDIDTPNGTAQPQKLEMLKSTSRVPPEILTKFQNIMNGGTETSSNYRSYRMHDDVVEARRLIEDMQEIARWLHREADRAGWSSPASPSANRGRASRSTLGPSYSSPSGGRSSGMAGGLLAYLEPYMPIVLIAGGVILVVGLGIGLAFALSGKGNNDAVSGKGPVVVSPTPLAEVTDSLTTDEPMASATPKPEQSVYLDELEDPSSISIPTGFHKKQWTFKDQNHTFVIETRQYQHGIGLYVPYKSITGTSASNTIKYQLDGKYDTFRFDLGVDGDLSGYSSKNGKYQIKIYADENATAIWDSKQLAFDETKMGVSVPVTGVTSLKIRLTEFKGTGNATLNVVLGSAKLVTGGDGSTEPGNGEPTNEESSPPDNGASASPKAGASAEPTDTGTTE